MLEADRVEGEEFDDLVEELAGKVNHHLTEEELTILNPAREDGRPRTSAADGSGAAFAEERNRQLDADCGRRRERPRPSSPGPGARACSPRTGGRRGLSGVSRAAAGRADDERLDAGAARAGASSISSPPSGACSIQRVPSASTGLVTNPTW